MRKRKIIKVPKKQTALSPMGWIWEFTKKVVSIVTVLYIISFVFSITAIAIMTTITHDTACLDTLITETNETFRFVVGGYLVKAGIENACKIVTSTGQQDPAIDEAENEEARDIPKGGY